MEIPPDQPTIRIKLVIPQGSQYIDIPADRPRLSMLKLEQQAPFWESFSNLIFYRGHGDERIDLMTELHDGDQIAITKRGQPNPLKPKTEP